MSKKMNIKTLLKKAEAGTLEECKGCPWKRYKECAFGTSCIHHGLNWKKNQKALVMIIFQDPAGTTPHKTGNLCLVHNAKNPTDKTAQLALHLWKAAVSFETDSCGTDKYMKKTYLTNATMHGVLTKDSKKREKARKKCAEVLKLQIKALQPEIIIAMGKEAVDSLYEIGVIKKNWNEIKRESYSPDKAYKVYSERVLSWENLTDTIVFCTYHTALKVVNQTLSKFSHGRIERKIKNKKAIKEFLEIYSDLENKTARGMRFLLNHWIEIGKEIRKRFKE